MMNVANPLGFNFNQNNNQFKTNSNWPTFANFGNTSQNTGLLANSTAAAVAKNPIPAFNFGGNATPPVFGNTATTTPGPFCFTGTQTTTPNSTTTPSLFLGWNKQNQTPIQPTTPQIQQPFSFFNNANNQQQTPPTPNFFQFQPQQQQQQTPQTFQIQQAQQPIDPHTYIAALEHHGKLLLDEFRRYENQWFQVNSLYGGTFLANPGFIGNPQQQINYPLQGLYGATLSGQLPCPPPQELAPPYVQYPTCRPSTLALDYMHELNKTLGDPEYGTRLLWSCRDKTYPLKAFSSVNSSLRLPTRSYGSTCLSDQYRDKHFNSTSSKFTTVFDDRNYLKHRTKCWKNGHGGYTYRDYERTPEQDRFRVGAAADFYLNKLGYRNDKPNQYNDCLPMLTPEADRKWKVLTLTRQLPEDDWGRSGRGTASQEKLKKYDVISNKTFNSILSKSDPRQREADGQKMWHWLQIGRSTGPPLKSHLDDGDLELYENFKTNRGKQPPEIKVANLPGRFVAGPKNIQSELRSILKSSSTNTRNKTKVTKEDVQSLYKRWQTGASKEDVEVSSEVSSTVALLEEKTSPVFFSKWKTRKSGREDPSSQTESTASSSGTQTDKPLDKDDYFTTKFQDGCKKTGDPSQDISKVFISLDPYRGRFQTTGRRIGQHDEQESLSCSSASSNLELLYAKASPKTLKDPSPVGNSDSSSISLDQTPSSGCGQSGVRLSRTEEGYYCIPDVGTLNRKTIKNWGCLHVKDFEVGHREYGKVVFSGYTNVFGLNLDKIILFGPKSLSIYPDQDQTPAFGHGLNKPCTVTLYNVWPPKNEEVEVERGEGNTADTLTGFEKRLRKSCERFEGTFINYCPLYGKWTFRVQECVQVSDGEEGDVDADVDSDLDL